MKFLHKIDFNGSLIKCRLQECRKIIFLFLKNKKTDFWDNFVFFGTLLRSYLLNHLSYRPEIFTQNRLQEALQKMSTTEVSQNSSYISKIKKLVNLTNF